MAEAWWLGGQANAIGRRPASRRPMRSAEQAGTRLSPPRPPVAEAAIEDGCVTRPAAAGGNGLPRGQRTRPSGGGVPGHAPAGGNAGPSLDTIARNVTEAGTNDCYAGDATARNNLSTVRVQMRHPPGRDELSVGRRGMVSGAATRKRRGCRRGHPVASAGPGAAWPSARGVGVRLPCAGASSGPLNEPGPRSAAPLGSC